MYMRLTLLSLGQRDQLKNVKVDDDDGHYIVQPDANLTDRCRSHSPFCFDSCIVYLYTSGRILPNIYFNLQQEGLV